MGRRRWMLSGAVALGLIAGGWTLLPDAWAYAPACLFAAALPWLRTSGQDERGEGLWRTLLTDRPELDPDLVRRMVRHQVSLLTGAGLLVCLTTGWVIRANGPSIPTVAFAALGVALASAGIRLGSRVRTFLPGLMRDFPAFRSGKAPTR